MFCKTTKLGCYCANLSDILYTGRETHSHRHTAVWTSLQRSQKQMYELCLFLHLGPWRPGIKRPSYGDSALTHSHIHIHIHKQVLKVYHRHKVLFESTGAHFHSHPHTYTCMALHRKAYMYAGCFFIHEMAERCQSSKKLWPLPSCLSLRLPFSLPPSFEHLVVY